MIKKFLPVPSDLILIGTRQLDYEMDPVNFGGGHKKNPHFSVRVSTLNKGRLLYLVSNSFVGYLFDVVRFDSEHLYLSLVVGR
jgi:hypothetical protein